MEKFIPYEKLSKKKKRELNESRRTRWTISPVTRRPENPKAYNRKKAQKRMDDPASVLSLFYKIVVPRLRRGRESGPKNEHMQNHFGAFADPFSERFDPSFYPRLIGSKKIQWSDRFGKVHKNVQNRYKTP